MALPKLDSPTYETELPSHGKRIKYRPFLVKEQKLLLMSQESKDPKEQMNSMGQIISARTFNKVDPFTSPLFDIEYLFLKIREKSVGANVTVMVTCPDDNETKVPVKIDLEKVGVHMTVGHTNEIELSDNMKMIMKYPLLSDIANTAINNEADTVFSILQQCVYEVHHGETVYNRVDVSDKDLEEFIDSFSTQQFEMVTNFFETMPRLRHELKYTNKNGTEQTFVIEGMRTFFT